MGVRERRRAATKPRRLARRAAATLVLTAGVLGSGGWAAAAAKPAMPAHDMAKMEAASAAAQKAVPKAVSTIVIKNFSFSPGAIKVKPGQEVKVTNRDSVVHTVTSLTGKFNTGNVKPGETVVFTAPKKAGTYPYRCNIHQYMTAKLVVTKAPEPHVDGHKKTHH